MSKCDCEHRSHFEEAGVLNAPRTTHAYGEGTGGSTEVKTQHGTFHLCDECQTDGHIPAEYRVEASR